MHTLSEREVWVRIRVGHIGHSVANSCHRCDVFSELCCTGATTWRWAPLLVTRFSVIPRVFDVQNYPVFSPSTEVAGFTPFDCISIPPVSISLDPRHLPFLTPTSSLLLQLFSSMCLLADLFFFYP